MIAFLRGRCARSAVVGLQVAALAGLAEIGRLLAALSPLPVPAGAVGLLLLFALLASGAIRVAWIAAGADLLVRHLGLFLVPYAVGFMAFGDLVRSDGLALLLTIVASTALGMAACGLAAQAATRLPQPARGADAEAPR